MRVRTIETQGNSIPTNMVEIILGESKLHAIRILDGEH
jgi:hypothetical protein